MGQNNSKGHKKLEKMGIKPNMTINSEILEIIWNFYTNDSNHRVMKRPTALLCLREIGEAIGIEYDEPKAVEILLSVSPEGSLNRHQFEELFCQNAYETAIDLSQSVRKNHPNKNTPPTTPQPQTPPERPTVTYMEDVARKEREQAEREQREREAREREQAEREQRARDQQLADERARADREREAQERAVREEARRVREAEQTAREQEEMAREDADRKRREEEKAERDRKWLEARRLEEEAQERERLARERTEREKLEAAEAAKRKAREEAEAKKLEPTPKSTKTHEIDYDAILEATHSQPLVRKVAKFDVVPAEDFVNRLLNKVAEEIGPYSPFCLEDDEPKEVADLKKWKCLNILRAIDWNLGKVDTILDDQEAIFRKAGILEEPVSADKEDNVECSCCFSEVTWDETSALECGHRFCNECWSGTISNTLGTYSWETLFDHFTCMQRDCTLAILGPLVIRNTTKEQWNHYCNMLARAFTAHNAANHSLCPNDKCSKVAISKPTNTSDVVECTCGRSYCKNCTMQPHSPASCKEVETWKAKTSDDQVSIDFIKATTTICPSCGTAIDRTSACNHITCKCGCHFCFLCRSSPWCSAYSCNKFKTKEEATKSDKFGGYSSPTEWLLMHERYTAFDKKATDCKVGVDFVENNLAIELVIKSEEYHKLKNGAPTTFITNGANTLAKSYKVMMYLLIWGFYNIPAKICPQKTIYEMQIKTYEDNMKDLKKELSLDTPKLDAAKIKRITTILQDNFINQMENSSDLVSMFSVKQTGDLGPVSIGRWTCVCNYSNADTQVNCYSCQKPRPEVKASWFS